MESIYQLLKSLNSNEWRSFQSFLSCFSSHDERNIRVLNLAKHLVNSPKCPTDRSSCIAIYGSFHHNKIHKLKGRLKDKLLDFLSTDVCDKKHELDGLDLAHVRIKKLSAQYQQLMYSKQGNELTSELMEEIISTCKEFEYYPALVEHLIQKKWKYGWKLNKSQYDILSNEIELYKNINEKYVEATDLYYGLFRLYDFNAQANKDAIERYLLECISKLEIFYSTTKSSIILYYLKMMEMDYFSIKENYSQARSLCTQVLDIVRNSKSVYRKQRIGAVYDNLARCEFYLGNLEASIEAAQLAQKLFKEGTENHCIALEQEFYAQFKRGKLNESLELSNKMASSATRKELGDFRFAKYQFLKASALFRMKRFYESSEILSCNLLISNDKAGWDIGIRFLKALALIELNKPDQASLVINNLKKFILYSEKKKIRVRKRDKKIVSALLLIMRNSFRFNMLNGKADEYLKILSSDKPEYKWEPFSHEVFPFQDWLKDKLKNVRSRQFAEVQVR